MTENTTKNKETIDSTVKPSSPQKGKLKQYNGLRPVYLMCLIAIVLSVIALIEVVHLARQVKPFDNFEATHINQINKKITAQTHQVAILSNQLQALQANIASNKAKIVTSDATLANLKQVKFANNTRWMLAEVKYLLTLAQYNLQLNYTPETALAILKTVDSQLAEMNAPNTLLLRQQVINTISTLESSIAIDYSGILMKLNAIGNQLKTMPLLINTSQQTSQKTFSSPIDVTGWRKYWNESLKTLEKLFIIRHQNQTIIPLISPKQQLFLEENIQLKLSQASWALLHHNQAVYILSLKDAISWIQTYYSPNSAATANAIATLQSLMKINLQPKLPDLNKLIALTSSLLNATSFVSKGAN